jgi:hypothetical protein
LNLNRPTNNEGFEEVQNLTEYFVAFTASALTGQDCKFGLESGIGKLVFRRQFSPEFGKVFGLPVEMDVVWRKGKFVVNNHGVN